MSDSVFDTHLDTNLIMKNLIKTIYKTESANVKYFLDEDNSIEDLWNNIILFVPFKINKMPCFTYRETFHILFCLYKLIPFESNIENEIFTLGVFIRVIIHEVLGNLMISYFYYMLYVNSEEYGNYNSPKIIDKIKGLNRKTLCDCVGNLLAKIFNDKLLKIEEIDSFKNKLCEEFENIIGKEYAEKVIKILFEDKEINIFEIKKENNLFEISTKIIDILKEIISEEFNSYILELQKKELKYKEDDSGNLVEFLLFNDFSQYISLKECLFLLNEENYEKTNIFKYRLQFKKLEDKKNDDFVKELINGDKIFKDLFSLYKSFYEKNKNENENLNIKKNFRENSDENLNKKFESFQCINKKLNWHHLLKIDN